MGCGASSAAQRLRPIAHSTRSCYLRAMNDRVENLWDEAARLSAEVGIALIERLQAGLDPVAASIDGAWAETGERRLDAYLAGEIPARDADEVLSKYLKS